MAALWRLPVVYVCENNLYNEYTSYRETTAGEILARPRAFGLAAEEVDGQDARAVLAAAGEVVGRTRRGEGPAFLLCHTYRFMGHHVGDVNRAYYRTKDEEQRWRAERDPIKMLAAWLSAEKLAGPADLMRVEQQIRAEIAAGVAAALEAPYPDPGEVTQDVYA